MLHLFLLWCSLIPVNDHKVFDEELVSLIQFTCLGKRRCFQAYNVFGAKIKENNEYFLSCVIPEIE